MHSYSHWKKSPPNRIERSVCISAEKCQAERPCGPCQRSGRECWVGRRGNVPICAACVAEGTSEADCGVFVQKPRQSTPSKSIGESSGSAKPAHNTLPSAATPKPAIDPPAKAPHATATPAKALPAASSVNSSPARASHTGSSSANTSPALAPRPPAILKVFPGPAPLITSQAAETSGSSSSSTEFPRSSFHDVLSSQPPSWISNANLLRIEGKAADFEQHIKDISTIHMNETFDKKFHEMLEEHIAEMVTEQINETFNKKINRALEKNIDEILERKTNDVFETIMNGVIEQKIHEVFETTMNVIIEQNINDVFETMLNVVIERNINEVFETRLNKMVDKKITEAFERMNIRTPEEPRISVPPQTRSVRFHFDFE